MTDKFSFRQSYTIGIRDINYGKHMDHLALISSRNSHKKHDKHISKASK
jgi:hypothetical protein